MIQCLEILPVCFIFLKQFLDSLDAGFMAADDLARRGEMDILGVRSTDMSTQHMIGSVEPQERYVRLNEEHGSLRTDSDDFESQFQQSSRSTATAFRARAFPKDFHELQMQGDRIEMRREVTIEEGPAK